ACYRRAVRALAIAVAGVLCLAGCASETPARIVAYQRDCSGVTFWSVYLETDPYDALVNAPPANAWALAHGYLRVAPDNPDNSFLVTKLALPVVSDQD